jgi:cyclophilin family peptidyl-prolyl cis-trans isomerase
MRPAAALLLIPAFCLLCPAQQAPDPEPTGPVAVIDTPMGRVTCTLYANLAPQTTANFAGLATGTKDWKDQTTGQVVHNKPFYDGLALTGSGDAFAAGDRIGDRKGLAGDPFPEEKNGLTFDRPGRLAMYVANGQTSSSQFFITDHANAEIDEAKRGLIFGQCNDASVAVVRSISHLLLSTDNHPKTPVAISHIAILQPGQPLPPPAAPVPLAEVVPQPTPAPVWVSPNATGPTALIDTTQGRFTCQLFEQTPLATNTFIGLAEGTRTWNDPRTNAIMHGHFYDGLHINRILPDFMVQNQEYPNDDPSNDNETIGIHYPVESIPGLTFDRPGRLAMANGGPDTNDSQFFITEVPRHSLDTKYTIFGQCDDASVALARRIANLPRNEHNRPLTPVTITRVFIVRAKPAVPK